MSRCLIAVLIFLTGLSVSAKGKVPAEKDFAGYLFTYFTGNNNEKEEEAIRFALSDNGYDFKALNGNRPVIKSSLISETGGVRDPHILRGPDNCFYMVVTDMVCANGWDSNRAMVLLKSCDLVNWTHAGINIQKKYKGQENLKRVWAPQTIYDPKAKKFLIYWSMQHGNGPDIIYYAYANKDFTDIEGEPKPFFLPKDGKSCIDGDIVYKDGTYYLFYKTEGHGNGIKVATTKDLTSGNWTEYPDYKQQTKEAVEGAGTFKLIGQDKYILMYDVYKKGGYDFTETTDLQNFKNTERKVTMNFHPRHGTVIPVTAEEMARLKEKWGDPDKGIDEASVSSPDGKVRVDVKIAGGVPSYSVFYNGKEMIENSPLGVVADYGDFSKNLKMIARHDNEAHKSLNNKRIKRSGVNFNGNTLECEFRNSTGDKMGVEFVVSNNDVAFRYNMKRPKETGSARIMKENTGFHLPSSTTVFLSPQSDAMIGWKRTKPSYEEEYIIDAPLDTKSKYGHGFTFPALFKVGNDGWVLISETGVDRNYCGSRLTDQENGVFSIAFPMAEENNGNGTSEPAFALPGSTPWRTITLADNLAPIVETTAPWNTVNPRFESDYTFNPSKATWSWIVWQDNSINKADIKKYIDLAAAMGYPYTLIDCGWDTNIGRDGIEELIEYGKDKGVTPLMWYSSSGYWNDITQSPINIMDNPIARKKEMKWLQSIGVKGIKVDFFGGDKQETMRLYEDILSDAADHGLMVIFHGCTLPRGWEEMYPNYVGSEAVLASENMIFSQDFCDMEAVNATLHPFIRNTVGAMEYGGSFLNKRLHKSNEKGNIRRTSDAFQLALATIFQSPAQNFALAPNNLEDASPIALDFMREVPTLWEDTKYVAGYPGKYAVIARKSNGKWYVSGINAMEEPVEIDIDLGFIGDGAATIYKDSDNGSLLKESLTLKADKKGVSKFRMTLPKEQGFVITK
ncbi:MAG: glycoside hydrolase family 97 catalytic domain-containing protein [Muribaculaceae bacterium]|nr:glycoside hydrolase family 97 catalytic domain-containing protein [Muribaculaceae bacterium]